MTTRSTPGACRRQADRSHFLVWAVALGLLAIAAFNLTFVLRALGPAGQASDFRWWYGAAELGLQRGWNHLYDPALQAQYISATYPFVNPPPLAWLVVPLTNLPEPIAYVVFALLLVGCLILASQLASGPRPVSRVLAFGTAFGLFPAMISIVYGQPVAIALLAIVGAWWLDKRGRPILAGVILSFIVVKPNIVVLVPLALLLSARHRAFVAWAIATAALAAISAISVGLDNLRAYLHLLAIVGGQKQSFTLGSGWVFWVAVAVIVGLTSAVAWKRRGSGFELPLAVALAGSLLISHHLNVYDLALYAPVLWLVYQGDLHWTAKVAAAGMWVLLDVAIVNSTLIVTAELALLLVLVLNDLVLRRGGFLPISQNATEDLA
ncbi:MAG TPA: glycosyltransferase family 87 protein [Candidatus Dormibacteraeota bacterium]|nr:glycosyltransferase family 87 protein [Candidatus Dormibacteraeota bacterium]